MLAARLAWYTKQNDYAKWAAKVWDWSTTVDLINNKTWAVGDSVRAGSGGSDGCSLPDNTRWSYNSIKMQLVHFSKALRYLGLQTLP